jgi:hypothetical protein
VDRLGGNAQCCGDLLVAQTAEIMEHDHFFRSTWQTVNGSTDVLCAIAFRRRFSWRWRFFRQGKSRLQLRLPPGDLAADAADPRGEFSLAPQAVERAASDGERLLGGIFGQMAIRQCAERNPNRRAVMPPVQLAKTVHVALASCLDQFRIGGIHHSSNRTPFLGRLKSVSDILGCVDIHDTA